MKWRGRQGSQNVDDRRGMGGKVAVGGGLGGLVILVLTLLFGGNPGDFTSMSSDTGVEQASSTAYDEQAQFVSVVLKETEDVWNELFPKQLNKQYDEPVLVMFSGSTESSCGAASSATGPFYCPADEQVYIDLSFSDLLRNRFKAPGEFAMAYVIAHEVGHHIQNELGISDYVRQQQRNMSKEEANQLSVRLELQADFLAGVWAHHADRTKGLLEEGDIDAALAAANAIGDDRLQMEAQGYVVPESFTHGTSKQRKYWFMRGYQSGDINQGDTFSDPS